ncbi:GLPGLI family protein [Chryseobacterium salipaludis]|uniref:GLPGLI family protein n=1 Tax=Chryseobacterium TaxID=59732 RepID=UPI001FF41623|nr:MULTISPECIES: GLPGLI family protein [Chryseobacterium]MCJ8498518.1 GLPGLI family protein [Chryseobacterium salipaludis]MCX3297157.1 GLPGLI family protein [Planobacterium sp. JC490]
MKKISLLLWLCAAVFSTAQVHYLEYHVYTKSPVSEQTYHQLAQVTMNDEGCNYILLPVDNLDKGATSRKMVVYDKSNFSYTQYTSKDGALISDRLQGKKYLLKDPHTEMNWTLSDRTKIVDGRTLKKASTAFRGRHYTVWYDENVKAAFGPWKFHGLGYQIVEASCHDGNFRWVLKNSKELPQAKFAPALAQTESTSFRPYTDYPKLAYGLSPELKMASSKNPHNTMIEQERHQLETKFDWEE